MMKFSLKGFLFSLFLILFFGFLVFCFDLSSRPPCYVSGKDSVFFSSLRESFRIRLDSLQKENLFLKERLAAYEDIGIGSSSHHHRYSVGVSRFFVQFWDGVYHYYGLIFSDPREKQQDFSVHYSVKCIWSSPSGSDYETLCVSPAVAEFRYFTEIYGILPSPKDRGRLLKRALLLLHTKNFSEKWMAYPLVPEH